MFQGDVALSIKYPWTLGILHNLKTIEIRVWKSRRQNFWVLIHESRKSETPTHISEQIITLLQHHNVQCRPICKGVPVGVMRISIVLPFQHADIKTNLDELSYQFILSSKPKHIFTWHIDKVIPFTHLITTRTITGHRLLWKPHMNVLKWVNSMILLGRQFTECLFSSRSLHVKLKGFPTTKLYIEIILFIVASIAFE